LNNTASIIYSIFLFFGMFSFAGAALLLIQFKDQRQPYISSWIIGLLLLGFAVTVVSLKDVAPEFVAYKLGNSLNVAAYVYFYYSCLSLLGNRIVFHQIAIKAIVSVVIFTMALLLVSEFFDSKYQPALVALCGLVFNFIIGILAFKLHKKDQTRLAYALGAIFYLTAIVWGIRFIMILFGQLSFGYQGGPINLVTFLLLSLLGMAKYLCFAGLVVSIEWSEKKSLIAKNNEITELLKEKERLIYGLMKANKTAATGALSASIAHELNQPLGASNLNIQFLKMKLEKGVLNPELGKEILDSLEQDNKRAATIVKSLRSIFTEGESNAQDVQLGDLISKVLDIVRPEIKSKNIQIQLRVDDDLGIRVNPSEIEQVILNLINNASQALANSGTLDRNIVIEAHKTGDLVFLAVSDNGEGVPMNFKSQLFELLSTTKQTGMGLGLWLCKHIVTRYGGSIYYEDAKDGGAKFVMELPAS